MMRAKIKISIEGERPHTIDAAVNMSAPTNRACFGPTRSASLPAGISRAAKVIVYAFRTQDNVDVVAAVKD